MGANQKVREDAARKHPGIGQPAFNITLKCNPRGSPDGFVKSPVNFNTTDRKKFIENGLGS